MGAGNAGGTHFGRGVARTRTRGGAGDDPGISVDNADLAVQTGILGDSWPVLRAAAAVGHAVP